ncbi:MAG: alpha/beta hydrolase [Anaerolineae bacterium]|nr:alpha/beta hydrolase [Anaerolineae bacterium]
MPFIDIATGAHLHYEDEGAASAPPLIALHGRFGTARVDLSALIDWLSASYRVLGPSLRGYGQSTPKPRDYPLDFYHRDARDVLAFMDALGIQRAHLIGYSDGGETALVAAGLAPERFASVAVWGAVGYFGPGMRPWVQRNYPADWMDEATKTLNGIEDPNPIVLQWVQALKFMIDKGGDVSLSLAPKISCPVLLMLGVEDRLNPAAYGQRFVDAAPRGRLVLFQTGHGCHDEAPDQFRQVLGDFLRTAG